MVTGNWKYGDHFEVIEDSIGGYLKKGDKGIFYSYASLINTGNIPSINFTPEGNKAIHISRIVRIKKPKIIYELW